MGTDVSSAGLTGANFDTGRFASAQGGVPGLSGTMPSSAGSEVQGSYTGQDSFVKGGNLNSSYAGNAVFTNALRNDAQMEEAMKAAMERDAAAKRDAARIAATNQQAQVMASTPVNYLPAAQSNIAVRPPVQPTFTAAPATSYVAAPGGGYAAIASPPVQLATPQQPAPIMAAQGDISPAVSGVDPRYYATAQGDSLMISGRNGAT